MHRLHINSTKSSFMLRENFLHLSYLLVYPFLVDVKHFQYHQNAAVFSFLTSLFGNRFPLWMRIVKYIYCSIKSSYFITSILSSTEFHYAWFRLDVLYLYEMFHIQFHFDIYWTSGRCFGVTNFQR